MSERKIINTIYKHYVIRIDKLCVLDVVKCMSFIISII